MKIPNPRKLSNGTWFIYLRFNGDYISISAPTEKECIRLAQLRKAEHIAGVKERKQAPKKTTLYEGINMYIEDRKNVLSPCTIRGYRTIQRSRFQKSMSMPLEEMDRSYFQKMVNDEAKIVSAKTVGTCYSDLCVCHRKRRSDSITSDGSNEKHAVFRAGTYSTIYKRCSWNKGRNRCFAGFVRPSSI